MVFLVNSDGFWENSAPKTDFSSEMARKTPWSSPELFKGERMDFPAIDEVFRFESGER
jgi:hypothetical protein